jgi:signal transduction histidine kinase
MSHELRTPLNAIIGFTDLLLEESYGKMNKNQLEFISDIQDSSHHLLDMITRILDISKIESGELSINVEKFNLNNLITHVISTFKPLIQKKNLDIECNFVKKSQVIQADRVKLKQILYNLIGNAVKFTIEGKISLEVSDDDEYWFFRVKDTGIGIAKKDFEKIFKDFQRVKSAYVESVAGSGLGLALTKRIVNLHGGIITFESNLGIGTTFIFTIPKQYKNKEKGDPVHAFLNAL